MLRNEPSIFADQNSHLLTLRICSFGQNFVSGLLLGVTDLERLPGAFWVSLGTNQTSACTIIVVYLYLTYFIFVKVLYLGYFGELQIWRGVETYIYPVISYGLDAATWTKDNIKKIETLQNSIMRAMLGKKMKGRIPISQLKTDTGLKSLFQIIKKAKVKLFGKVKEEKDENITIKC